MCLGKDTRGKEKEFVLYNVADTPIIRHIKVKGTNSPDDPNLKKYWDNRKTKQGKQFWAKGSKYEALAKEQNYKCPVCGEFLFNGEEIETHHLVPVQAGGLHDIGNLVHLHKACHKQVHGKQASKAGSVA